MDTNLIYCQNLRDLYTVERHYTLLMNAKDLLQKLNARNIFFKFGDGGLGWLDQAPFDRIIVTACAPEIPKNLVNQLDDNGIMIIPIGEDNNIQVLKKIVKKGKKILSQDLMEVRFVPLLEGKVEY